MHPGAIAFFDAVAPKNRPGPVLTLVPDFEGEERRLSVMMQSLERDYQPLRLSIDDVQQLARYCVQFVQAGRWVHPCTECNGDGKVLGDCGESPNVWFDKCTACDGSGREKAP